MRPHGFCCSLILACSLSLGTISGCSEEETDERTFRRPPQILTEVPEIVPLAPDLEPSPLVGPFQSLMTLDEAIAQTGDLPFETIGNRIREKRGTCPGQHRITLQITRFWDLERKGTLQLEFFDGLLTTAWFKTFDVEGYRTAYFDMHDIERRNRWKPAYILPGTVIRNPVTGNEGILAHDFRLQNWADSVEKACHYQWQHERGWHEPGFVPKVGEPTEESGSNG